MRTLLIALIAAFFTAAPGDARAQVDPINWCPDGPSVVPVPWGDRLERAFAIERTILRDGDFFALGQEVATLDVRSAPVRVLASAEPSLGLAVGVQLTPLWIIEPNTDALNQGRLAYCTISGSTTNDRRSRPARTRPGVCLQSEDNRPDIVVSGFTADFDEPRAGQALTSGRMVYRAGGPGYGRDFGAFGVATAPEGIISRSLRLGGVRVQPAPAVAVWSRRAFERVEVQFSLEGSPPFHRGLNEPLHVEDGWLVVTGVDTARGAEISRMSNEGWLAFQQTRCAVANAGGS